MTYTVKQLSDLAEVSVRTLHYYDQIDLLTPDRGDNGYRYYAIRPSSSSSKSCSSGNWASAWRTFGHCSTRRISTCWPPCRPTTRRSRRGSSA